MNTEDKTNPQLEQPSRSNNPYRDLPDRKLMGVAAALAGHFGFPVALVRLAFVLLTFFHGLGLLLYISTAAALPFRKDENSLVERLALAGRGFTEGFGQGRQRHPDQTE